MSSESRKAAEVFLDDSKCDDHGLSMENSLTGIGYAILHLADVLEQRLPLPQDSTTMPPAQGSAAPTGEQCSCYRVYGPVDPACPVHGDSTAK